MWFVIMFAKTDCKFNQILLRETAVPNISWILVQIIFKILSELLLNLIWTASALYNTGVLVMDFRNLGSVW